jgi:hypothetical protein
LQAPTAIKTLPPSPFEAAVYLIKHPIGVAKPDCVRCGLAIDLMLMPQAGVLGLDPRPQVEPNFDCPRQRCEDFGVHSAWCHTARRGIEVLPIAFLVASAVNP